MSNDTYQYKPIPRHRGSRCIRVFEIEAHHDLDGPIRGKMQVVDLNETAHIPFTALSYVWGEPGPRPPSVFCDDKRIPILPNGYCALRFLRKKLGTFTIWTDAISINQKDDREKETQIPLMGDIYTKSESVYIWLGEGDSRTLRAMAFLERPPFLKYFSQTDSFDHIIPRPQMQCAVWAYVRERLKFKKTLFPSTINPSTSSTTNNELTIATFGDLDALLDTEWLERIWTYQEILLASKPVVVSGTKHVSWDLFTLSIAFLEYSGIVYRENGPKLASLNAWNKVALSRDYIFAISRKDHDLSTQSTNVHKTTTIGDLNSTRLRKYISFIHAIVKHEEQLKNILVRVPLGLVAGVELFIFCFGLDEMRSYRNANHNLDLAASYSSRVSSVISTLMATSLNLTAMPTATTMFDQSKSPTITSKAIAPTTSEWTTIVRPLRDYPGTSIMEILSSLYNSQDLKATKVIGSAMSAISTAVSSVILDCQSSCDSIPVAQDCVQSCCVTNRAMPTARVVQFREADIPNHRPQQYYKGVMLLVATCFAMLLLIGFGYYFLHLHRRKASIRYTQRSHVGTLDLVDGLCKRRAKIEHDKAYALHNILRRISKLELPIPDYSRSLEQTFADSNVHLLKTMGYEQLLAVAASNHISGSLSWMPDWSKKVDKVWLDGSLPEVDHRQDRPLNLNVSNAAELGEDKQLTLTARTICKIQQCFKFSKTNDSYTPLQNNEQHANNLDVALNIFRENATYIGTSVNPDLTKLVSRGAPSVPPKEIKIWMNFLTKNYRKATKVAFQLMLQKLQILNIHIAICDELAGNKKQLFGFSFKWECKVLTGEHGMDKMRYFNYAFGLCSCEVREGHWLLMIPGVSMPLVVNVVSDENLPMISARLVSPAIVRGVVGGKEWRGAYRRLRCTREVQLTIR